MATKYPKHPRYIPIIKWQSWEQKALQKVEGAIRPQVLPCIEVRTSKQHLNLLKNLNKVWPYDALVDYADPKGRLTPVRTGELLSFMKSAVDERWPVTPVLSPADVMATGNPFLGLATTLGKVAVRLRIDSLIVTAADVALTASAFSHLKAANVSASLIIDLGVSPQAWEDKHVADFIAAIRPLQAIGFSTLHLTSGSYPGSLASVKTGVASFERKDWKFWKAISAKAPDLIIGYSDYGTLSPVWTEDILELRSSRIAIRYTRDNDWLILRADGKKAEDSVAISALLVNNYKADFKGAAYSYGDELLEERANPAISLNKKHCGHYHITEGWSHHIALVLKDQY
ncbi:beta family protein [Pseudomonas brassicacearum]|jgi:hypothetical protein|uniref:beta family protein n=1 Tax=Pseudomonas brassicacearum TaxID=930166 RepID=UPI000761D50B|nr:hypothetical protein [Pseudomonas brassicacearum]AOS40475.1 hypothetical protein A0U95_17340 [Pseudomonas brassicacearum]